MTGHNEFPTEVINCQQISIGNGGGADEDTLITFNTPRAWKFKQNGAGSGTRLSLVETDETASKVFEIGDASLGGKIEICNGSASASSATIKITDSKDAATAYALDIDRDGNSASKVVGARIVVDNAGAGNVIGIDMSSFSAGECLIKTPASAITSAGTLSHQIPIDIGGTTFYLYAYTTGS